MDTISDLEKQLYALGDQLSVDEYEYDPSDEAVPDDDDFSQSELDQLDPASKELVNEIILRTITFCEKLSEVELRPYQTTFAYRMVESLILADGEEITATWSRQSGKSETVSIVISGVMVLFPVLAKIEPFSELLGRFRRGVWVGLFAPVDTQSEFIYGRVADKLTSERAKEFLSDAELSTDVKSGAKVVKLSTGSFARRQTANPSAKIEGSTYHIIIIDEAQEADEYVVRKSIHPMLSSTAGPIIKIGTPSFTKGDYYKAIQNNKRRSTRRGGKNYHFEYDWKVVAKYNAYYKRFVEKELIRLGEGSDEFQMSYALKWMIDRGMFVTEERLDYLADKHMQIVKSWNATPCVAGIDVARVKDSTVVTVCWVDWDHPDPSGMYEHRVLNWLEINNAEWERQYYEIADFLAPYNIVKCGVDSQGMGSAVAERLDLILGNRMDIVPVNSDLATQDKRWSHLTQLLQRNLIIYPGHSKARRKRTWKSFRQQMEDAEKVVKGQYILIQAPADTKDAHDDYVDSLAIATAMTMGALTDDSVESLEAPWFR